MRLQKVQVFQLFQILKSSIHVFYFFKPACQKLKQCFVNSCVEKLEEFDTNWFSWWKIDTSKSVLPKILFFIRKVEIEIETKIKIVSKTQIILSRECFSHAIILVGSKPHEKNTLISHWIAPQKMTIFKIFDVKLYLSVQKWPKRLKTLSTRFLKAWDPYFHLSWSIKWSLNYLSEILFKSKY